MSLIMADLDLLRDINNTYGHLAGDAVLRGRRARSSASSCATTTSRPASAARSSRSCCRRPSRRRRSRSPSASAAPSPSTSSTSTPSSEPIHVTVSLGVASFPRDGNDANELVHQADLAVYRAKIQGRNRVVDASDEPVLAKAESAARRASPPCRRPAAAAGASRAAVLDAPRRRPPRTRAPATSRPHARVGPRFFSMPARLTILVGVIGTCGITIGLFAAMTAPGTDVAALLAIVALVGAAQALSIEVERTGTISVTAVGALAGAAIVGPRGALVTALTIAAVDWTRAAASSTSCSSTSAC